jgi:LEA14-like dessication related protein
MATRRRALAALATVTVATLLGACASMPGREPVQVSVVGIEPLAGEGMELRFNVKLRVQNPNDAAIDFDGLFVELDVQGKSFATGVSDAKGTIPRFGETVLVVPVSVSALRAVRQIIGVATGGQMPQKIDYELRGKIGGPLFNSVRFEHKGEMALPGEGAR